MRITLKTTFTYLIISIFILKIVSAQECEENYVNYRFQLEICNNSKWSIVEKLPYISIKQGKLIASIFPSNNNSELSPDSSWMKHFYNDKKNNSSMEIIKKESVLIGNQPGVFGITHQPKIETGSKFQREAFYISALFNFNGMEYFINNSCYDSSYIVAESFVREISNNIKVIIDTILQPTSDEIKLLNRYGGCFLEALKSKNSEKFKQLFIFPALVRTCFENQIRDKELRKRFIRIFADNWDDYEKEFVIPAVTSFESILTLGKKMGIKWKKIEMIAFDFTAVEGIPDIKTVEGHLIIRYASSEYRIYAGNLIFLYENWYLTAMNESGIVKL